MPYGISIAVGLIVFAARVLGAQISPSCLMNYLDPGCPLPVGWDVDWSLFNSTIAMPEQPDNSSLPNFTVAPGHHWGLVSLDWTVGQGTWLNTSNLNASFCEAASAANCAALKAAGSVKRCGIYHNIELALQWIESARAVMYDPDKADWFLQFTDGMGHKNGTVYNDHRSQGDQYFIDWRNPDAAAYFVAAIVNRTVELDEDLTFTDDRDGCCVEHENIPALLKLMPSEVAQLQFATQAGGQWLATSLATVGKTCWDCLGGYNLGVRPVSGPTCAPTMRSLCAPSTQGSSMLMGFSHGPDLNQTIAAFLVSRPPIAFLGSRWQDNMWSPLFNMDVGLPLGLCNESLPGVFQRPWTHGVAVLDCNTWTATLPFPMLPSV